MGKVKRPQFIIQGNLLSSQPRAVDYSELAKHQAELNALQLWSELTFFEKFWLVVSYPFRRAR